MRAKDRRAIDGILQMIMRRVRMRERRAHFFTGRRPEGVTFACLRALIAHVSVPNGVSKILLLEESAALPLKEVMLPLSEEQY